jgi:hypothetical protein
MYRIFQLNQFNRRNLINRDFEVSRDNFKLSVIELMMYYNHYGTHLISNHILFKILYNLANYSGSTLDRVRKVRSDIDNINQAMGITSYTKSGYVHTNTFYTKECLLVSCEFEPIIEVKSNWMEYRPVRVLTHPSTHLHYLLPPMGNDIRTIGNTIVGIDLPMLMAMFHRWGIEDNKRSKGNRESIEDFITKYVLPGMLPEHYDIVLRNRYYKLATNGSIDEPWYKQIVALPSYVNSLDKSMLEIIETVRSNQTISVSDMMRYPMLYSDNYLEAVPQCFHTLLSSGYHVTLQIYIDWLFIMTGILPETMRCSYSRRLFKKSMRYMSNNNTLAHMSDNEKGMFEAKLNYIQEYLK